MTAVDVETWPCTRCKTKPASRPGYYGPCVDCAAELNADAERAYREKLEVVVAALADGWTCDEVRRAWVRREPCLQCDGTRAKRGEPKCTGCSGTGSVEVVKDWE